MARGRRLETLQAISVSSPRLIKQVFYTDPEESKVVKIFEEFLSDERGAELAEYAVGTAILVAIAIVVYQVLGSAVNVKMNAVANEIQK